MIDQYKPLLTTIIKHYLIDVWVTFFCSCGAAAEGEGASPWQGPKAREKRFETAMRKGAAVAGAWILHWVDNMGR